MSDRPLLHAYPDARLDLHGRSRQEAEILTRNFVATQARMARGRIVHVITGKGTGALLDAVGRVLDRETGGAVREKALDLNGAGYRVRLR